MKLKRKLLGALTLCAAASTAAVMVLVCIAGMYTGANPSPDPAGTETRYEHVDKYEYPVVNWNAWHKENKDVIGWITIPGTKVDFPIVQAPPDDPTYYLTHDVHRAYNPLGCPYLDAKCAQKGFDSPNAVIFGHHYYNDEMFGAFTKYADEAWAAKHHVILLQTPSCKRALHVHMASVVNADKAEKRIEFNTHAAYRKWFDQQRDSANVVLERERIPDRVCTIVTCSYSTFANERTVTVAA